MNAPPPQDMRTITEAIDSLHASSRRSIPMFLIGLAATLVAAGVAIFYIIQLSSDLADAREQLARTQKKLVEAEKSLAVGHAVLRSVDEKIASSGEPRDREIRQIKAAISDLDRSQTDLAWASKAVGVAAAKITPANAPPSPLPTATPTAPGWYAVTASYPENPTGLREALDDVAKAARKGLCTEVWKTQISKHYAVILGPRATREVAQEAVALARASGMAADAFLQVDRDWERIPEGGKCETARAPKN